MPSRTRSRRPASRRPTGGRHDGHMGIACDAFYRVTGEIAAFNAQWGGCLAMGMALFTIAHGACFPILILSGAGRVSDEDTGRRKGMVAGTWRDQWMTIGVTKWGQDHPDRRPRLGAHRRSVPADEDRHSPIDAPDLPQRRARRQVRVAAAVELPPRQVQVPHGGQPRTRGPRPSPRPSTSSVEKLISLIGWVRTHLQQWHPAYLWEVAGESDG